MKPFIEKIGPHFYNRPESTLASCARCKYLKCDLVKSGRNPQWDYECHHPEVSKTSFAVLARDKSSAWIGNQPDTPEWCPEWKRNK